MPDFSTRVLRRELIDEGQVPNKEARRGLLDLRRTNRLFGGRRLLLEAVAGEVSRRGLKRFSVLDIASGSCDLPMAVLDWAQAERLEAQVFALEYWHRYLLLFRKEFKAFPRLYPFCADAFHAPLRDRS